MIMIKNLIGDHFCEETYAGNYLKNSLKRISLIYYPSLFTNYLFNVNLVLKVILFEINKNIV